MFKQVIQVVTFFPLGFLNGILDFREYFVVRNTDYSSKLLILRNTVLLVFIIILAAMK